MGFTGDITLLIGLQPMEKFFPLMSSQTSATRRARAMRNASPHWPKKHGQTQQFEQKKGQGFCLCKVTMAFHTIPLYIHIPIYPIISSFIIIIPGAFPYHHYHHHHHRRRRRRRRRRHHDGNPIYIATPLKASCTRVSLVRPGGAVEWM